MSTDTTATRAGGLLAPYVALPGVPKSRKPPLLPSCYTLVMDSSAEAVLGLIGSAERLWTSAAALAVMQRYPIASSRMRRRTAKLPSAGSFIMGRFMEYEKNITHDQVAPVLGLASPLSLPPLPIYRSRLPLHAVKRVSQKIDFLRVAHRDNSFSWGITRCCPRYLTAIFIALLDAFGGMIYDNPSRIPHPPDFFDPPAMIKHRLRAFGATALLVMVHQLRSRRREDVVAQLLAECEARDFENHQLGYWLPLIGVLCDKSHLQFFLYDSSDRRFYTSEPLTHFVEHGTKLESLMSIRIVAERFHDLFLLCLINGMRSHISCIEPRIMIHECYGVPVMARFRSSLSIAEGALETARCAADMAEATDQIERLHEAETLAEQAYEELKKSPIGGCVQRHMSGWNDEVLSEYCLPEDTTNQVGHCKVQSD